MNATVDSTDATSPAVAKPAFKRLPAEATVVETPPAATRPPRRRGRMIALAVVAFVLIAWGARFITHALTYEETDDAYVTGHLHQISPQINGTVKDVLVQENQPVKAGDVLITLDPLEFQIALQKAQAGVAQAHAQEAQAAAASSEAAAQLIQAQARLTQANALVEQASAQQKLAQQTLNRSEQLAQSDVGAITQADLDNARSAANAADGALSAARGNLEAIRAGIDSAKAAQQAADAQAVAARATVAADEAAVRDAQRQLNYASIRAPADGRIGNRNVESGNRVQAGQTLLALAQPDVWVVANFKETQLGDMKPGQPVEITIDAIPGTFHGTVESFAPASGAQFALLPADNATGNFNKVVQRVPVKIVFDAESLQRLGNQVRLGLSAVINVRVK